MKKLFCLFVGLCIFGFVSFAQKDTVGTGIKLSPKDSLFIEGMAFIAEQSTYTHPRYKLYGTENIYNLIKLDTATGALWQVQFEMNRDSDAMTAVIDETSLLWSDEEPRAGRFELYPTKNMYTFILLDTELGRTYQVQWSTKAKERFRMRIY